jgi:superfamily I DNA and/or RNA helicase
MFSHLTAESLGWLFVDEAGQATPQNAVGALWRCRRAVVVGDPLQLEPVVTLPFRAQQSLRRDAGVAERWLPVGNSVQTLADALMSVGTYLPDGYGGRRWVGAPLRVHRRCDDPMFTVVNRIAYDGLMLSAVGPRDELTLPKGGRALPDTKWLHVAGQAAERHWIPAEGECLRTMLCYLADHDYDMSQVMVIGPFRDVARGSTRIFRQFPGVRGGTIHTAQGKESDVVVLILGSDPGSPRARQWAASAPNLLNVAISRARRRLYVIGNRDAWQAQPYFADLAHLLPVREQ